MRYTLENMEVNVYQVRDLILIVHNTEIDAAFLRLSILAIQEQAYFHKELNKPGGSSSQDSPANSAGRVRRKKVESQ